jgi:hypothetical protein
MIIKSNSVGEILAKYGRGTSGLDPLVIRWDGIQKNH